MSSKTQNVGHFVEYRLKRIVNSSSDGAVKASLANLRRGIGTTPGDIPELWELFLQDLPEEMLSRSGVPTHAQWALYCTDVVCASSTGQRFAEGIYVSARKRSGKGSGLFDTW